MSDRKFVVDTNVLIIAVVFKTKNLVKALEICLREGDVMVPTKVETEYRTRLLDSKFDNFIGKALREVFLSEFLQRCEWTEPAEKISVARDTKDNMFLELSVASKAICLITGDKDLLVLNPFESIPMITPKEFLNTC
jgi:uncharacterized protein